MQIIILLSVTCAIDSGITYLSHELIIVGNRMMTCDLSDAEFSDIIERFIS